METFSNIFVSVFVFVAMVFIIRGLDLKKWSSWLLGVYGLITGLLMGWVWNSFQDGVTFGLLCAFAVLSGGAMTRWHRKTWGKKE
jgi:hypothetical protein